MICKRKPEKQHVHACAKTLPRRWLITLEVIKLKKEPRKSFYAVRNMHSQVCAELSPSLGSCQRADVLCRILCLVFVLFFFLNSTALWNPFLECQTYYDKSQVLQANPNLAGFRDGWYAIWELAHVSLWMESGNVGLPPMKFPPRVMRLMRTHPNSLHRRLSRAWKKGTGYPETWVAVREISSSPLELSVKHLEVLGMKALRGYKPFITIFRTGSSDRRGQKH